ncbi:hypothetical protein [Brevundimonas sp.]|uniref:hypothetical protein n=1 Tax=Brevundimonas sp. TaxID=1871086 RepID=UPI002D57C3C2|nr:hypothetical protein [Brevundimonas sp.]HYD27466.1 hypothetical protein [Brevundimonas sp.]
MGDMPHNRHGLIPMLVAIRVAAERKRRREAAEAAAASAESPEKPKKKRGWFG